MKPTSRAASAIVFSLIFTCLAPQPTHGFVTGLLPCSTRQRSPVAAEKSRLNGRSASDTRSPTAISLTPWSMVSKKKMMMKSVPSKAASELQQQLRELCANVSEADRETRIEILAQVRHRDSTALNIGAKFPLRDFKIAGNLVLSRTINIRPSNSIPRHVYIYIYMCGTCE